MIDEGYIKYQIDWQQAPPIETDISELIEVRNQLFKMGLIGFYEEHQVGYGNISVRCEQPGEFVVSGTQTGGIPVLDQSHFTEVTDWNLKGNRLSCRGPIKASSESLTHAAVYDCDPGIKAIIHVHALDLWKWMLDTYPFTHGDVPYGTPEMAMEVLRLYQDTDLPQVKSFAMAGHEEGIFTFGASLSEAMELLQEVVQRHETFLKEG